MRQTTNICQQVKRCNVCNQQLPTSKFYKHSLARDGLFKRCKKCHIRISDENNKKNPERTAKYKREHMARWREANAEKSRKRMREWKSKNPRSVAAINAKRRADKLQRTPPWADLEAIKAIYESCPDGHHVDHEYPLKGRTVSGLHVENNLRYLPAEENLRKGNKLPAS